MTLVGAPAGPVACTASVRSVYTTYTQMYSYTQHIHRAMNERLEGMPPSGTYRDRTRAAAAAGTLAIGLARGRRSRATLSQQVPQVKSSQLDLT